MYFHFPLKLHGTVVVLYRHSLNGACVGRCEGVRDDGWW